MISYITRYSGLRKRDCNTVRYSALRKCRNITRYGALRKTYHITRYSALRKRYRTTTRYSDLRKGYFNTARYSDLRKGYRHATLYNALRKDIVPLYDTGLLGKRYLHSLRMIEGRKCYVNLHGSLYELNGCKMCRDEDIRSSCSAAEERIQLLMAFSSLV